MDPTNSYDLNSTVEKWLKVNCPSNEFTDADINEFRDQFMCIVEELIVEENIETPKAVELAKSRMGDRYDWQGEMKVANENIFKLKEVIFILIGILLYILGYNLIISVNRLIFFISSYFLDLESSVNLSRMYFHFIYALITSGFVALYFIHQPIKWLFQKIQLNVKAVVVILILMITFILGERYSYPLIHRQIRDNVYLSLFLSYEKLFEYLFFTISTIGFVFIFKKYMKEYNM